MLCPHIQFKAEDNLFAVSEPISTYLLSAHRCPECHIILDAVHQLWPGWIDEKRQAQGIIQVIHKLGTRHDVPATFRLFQDGQRDASFQIFRRSTKEPMYEDVALFFSKPVLFQTLRVVGDSRSEAAFDRASEWLSFCLDNDKGCQAPDPDFMPSRLLDVSPSTSGGGIDPVLFNPTNPRPYACLSYCWGPDNSNILKTNRANIQCHRQQILFSLIPATIQDAIIVCRGLKIRYLWVDSLCIIQDDKDDWLRESVQMRDIYLNSILTIAAEEPASCKLGFLGKQRFGTSGWQRHLETDMPDAELFIRPKSPDSDSQHAKCSLDKRGWCLQESILPRRRLCFNGNEMTWECRGRNICECGHKLWAQQHESSDIPLKPPFTNPYRDWRHLVERFSDRSLTCKTDKLSAVSGLAKTIAQSQEDATGVSDSYHSGLWRKEFVSDLTWRVTSFETCQDPGPYRAPSWSWASVDGSVRYELHDMVSRWKYRPFQDIHCTVEEIVCLNALQSDATSPVIAGHAVLSAPLAPVEVVILDEALATAWESKAPDHPASSLKSEQRTLVRIDNLRSVEVFLDRRREITLRAGDLTSACWIEGQCKCGSCRVGSVALAAGVEQPFYCVKLFTWTAAGNLADSGKTKVIPREVWFLILQKSTVVEDEFERRGIGVWRSRFDRWTEGRDEECPIFERCRPAKIKIV